MNDMKNEFGKWWLESRGRGRPTHRYQFSENEIVSAAYPRDVSSWAGGTYLNLHPTHYAVAITPDGRIMNLKGGYNKLPPGRYMIHVVDKQNRVAVIPRTGETTSDGTQIALELVITYRVIDPIKALEVQQAVETLLRFIQSDLKEFIRSHKYDEIMGDLDGRKLGDELVSRYIKDQHANRHQMSKLFLIADIVVKEKVGDPKVIELREKYQIQQREFTVKSEVQRQTQELEQKLATQEATIKQMKADADARLQEVTKKMELQKIELENARSEFQFRQDNWKLAVDAIAQTLSNQTYPLDAQVFGVIRDLLVELGASSPRATETEPGQGAQAPNDSTKKPNPEKINELTKVLLNWQERKPS